MNFLIQFLEFCSMQPVVLPKERILPFRKDSLEGLKAFREKKKPARNNFYNKISL